MDEMGDFATPTVTTATTCNLPGLDEQHISPLFESFCPVVPNYSRPALATNFERKIHRDRELVLELKLERAEYQIFSLKTQVKNAKEEVKVNASQAATVNRSLSGSRFREMTHSAELAKVEKLLQQALSEKDRIKEEIAQLTKNVEMSQDMVKRRSESIHDSLQKRRENRMLFKAFRNFRGAVEWQIQRRLTGKRITRRYNSRRVLVALDAWVGVCSAKKIAMEGAVSCAKAKSKGTEFAPRGPSSPQENMSAVRSIGLVFGQDGALTLQSRDLGRRSLSPAVSPPGLYRSHSDGDFFIKPLQPAAVVEEKKNLENAFECEGFNDPELVYPRRTQSCSDIVDETATPATDKLAGQQIKFTHLPIDLMDECTASKRGHTAFSPCVHRPVTHKQSSPFRVGLQRVNTAISRVLFKEVQQCNHEKCGKDV